MSKRKLATVAALGIMLYQQALPLQALAVEAEADVKTETVNPEAGLKDPAIPDPVPVPAAEKEAEKEAGKTENETEKTTPVQTGNNKAVAGAQGTTPGTTDKTVKKTTTAKPKAAVAGRSGSSVGTQAVRPVADGTYSDGGTWQIVDDSHTGHQVLELIGGTVRGESQSFEGDHKQWEAYRETITKVVTRDVTAGESISYLFHGFKAVTEFDFGNSSETTNFDTSGTKDFSQAFSFTKALERFDFDLLAWGSGENFERMFSYSGIQSVQGKINLPAGEILTAMFEHCNSLTEISGIKAAKATDISAMFFFCGSLKYADISGINMANVIQVLGLFSGCSVLEAVNLPSYQQDPALVPQIDLRYMFDNCPKLNFVDMSAFNLMDADCVAMFYTTGDDDPLLILASAKTQEVLEAGTNAFNGRAGFTMDFSVTKPVGDPWAGSKTWDIFDNDTVNLPKKVVELSTGEEIQLPDFDSYVADKLAAEKLVQATAFAEATPGGGIVDDWTAADEYTTLAEQFDGTYQARAEIGGYYGDADAGTQGKWTIHTEHAGEANEATILTLTGGVITGDTVDAGGTTMEEGEHRAWSAYNSKINKVVLNDVEAGVTAANLFRYLENVTEYQGIENLVTENTTNLYRMFADNKKLTNLKLNGWDVQNVEDMYGLFQYCQSLTDVEVDQWNTAKVWDFGSLFNSCTSLEVLDLSGWDTGQGTGFTNMFDSCSALTSLDLSSFTVTPRTDGQLVDLYGMFRHCTNLQVLDISGIKTLDSSGEWIADPWKMFTKAKSLVQLSLNEDFRIDLNHPSDYDPEFRTDNPDLTWERSPKAFPAAKTTADLITWHNESAEGVVTYIATNDEENPVNYRYLTLHENGGAGATEKYYLEKTADATVPEMAVGSQTGYTPIWNTKADGDGADVALTAPLSEVAEEVTNLYTKWQANRYTVAFEANSGTGEMTPQNLVYDSEAALTANGFTKVGHRFAGWNTKADGSGTSYADEAEVSNLTAAAGGVVTLYAQWEAKSYTVTFDSNGGSGTMAPQEFLFNDVEKALRSNTFEKAGHVFTGWNTQADGKGADFAANEVVGNFVEDFTLYAQWRAELAITSTAKPANGTVGEAFSHQLTSNYDHKAVTWSFKAGKPGWLSINGDNQLVGTPDKHGVYQVTVVAEVATEGLLRANATETAEQTLTLTVDKSASHQALEDALAELVEYEEDVSRDPSDYFPENWQVYEEALEAAQKVLQDSDATVAELQTALDALKEAVAVLAADPMTTEAYTDLQALVDKIEQRDLRESAYSKASWQKFAAALAQAKALLADPHATEAQLKAALADLTKAHDGLTLAATSGGSSTTGTRKPASSGSTGTSGTSSHSAIGKTGMVASSGMIVAGLGALASALAVWQKRKK